MIEPSHDGPAQPLELLVVDLLGKRPPPDVGVQPFVERGEVRLPRMPFDPYITKRPPHQICELVCRTDAKRRAQRLSGPVAHHLAEHLDHRRPVERYGAVTASTASASSGRQTTTSGSSGSGWL